MKKETWKKIEDYIVTVLIMTSIFSIAFCSWGACGYLHDLNKKVDTIYETINEVYGSTANNM